MEVIRRTTRALIAEDGNIATVVELLEDAEDARYNLKPEIAALKKAVAKCLTAAESITAKFEYWYLVIVHLKQSSLTRQGMTPGFTPSPSIPSEKLY